MIWPIDSLRVALRKLTGLVRRDGLAGLVRRSRLALRDNMEALGLFQRNDYALWIKRYDRPAPGTLKRLQAATGPHAGVTLALRVPDTPASAPHSQTPAWLVSVQAVYDQHGGDRELILLVTEAQAAQAQAQVNTLSTASGNPPVLRWLTCLPDTPLTERLNLALQAATSRWFMVLNPGDQPAPHALLYLAYVLQCHPRAALVYTDEDTLRPRPGDAGKTPWRRTDPWFKPDWNPELFWSQNLTGRAVFYQTERLRTLGGFRMTHAPAWRYDAALRYVAALNLQETPVIHCPHVLYHRLDTYQENDQDKARASARALNDALHALGRAAAAEATGPATWRVRYALPDTPPQVTLMIPTRNRLDLLRTCLGSILERTTYPNYEILVIDNGSDDPATLAWLHELQHSGKIRLYRDDRPFNYSALNNAGQTHARGDFLCLVNNDIEVISPDWLDELVGQALQPGVGVVGARLLYADGTLQHAGVVTGIRGIAGHIYKHSPRNTGGHHDRARCVQALSAVTGACMLVHRPLWQQLGGLDAEHLTVAYNDVDFCLRAVQAGFRVVWTPHAELYHHESVSRGSDLAWIRQGRFAYETRTMRTRWGAQLNHDPAYSPNLTLDYEDASLAWPPRKPLHDKTH